MRFDSVHSRSVGRTSDVVVIDSDLGQSGASAVDRAGFQQLVAEVGMGRAGIVLGLEVSRLARNSTDWHRLLEICALTDTLILDEDGIYDPAHFNDRLLLGLKGTMSEAELHVLRARLRGGILNKARRGELRCRLPVGLVHDGDGRVVLDPDEAGPRERPPAVRDLLAHRNALCDGQVLPATRAAVPRAGHARIAQGRAHLGSAEPRPSIQCAAQPMVRWRVRLRPGALAQATRRAQSP